MTRYVIIGAGAIGATLAAQLHAAGIEHALVGRGAHIEIIRDQGLRYVHGGQERVVRVDAITDPTEIRLNRADVLVLATKVQDLADAVRVWAWQPVDFDARIGTASQLPVVTLQNGLVADRIALRRFERVLGGTIITPSQFVEPGLVRCHTLDVVGILTLGAMPHGVDDPALEIVAQDLRSAGYVVQLSPEVSRWKAAKLLHSVSNGVEVLDGSPDEVRMLRQQLQEEARDALAAAGIGVADVVAERTEDISGFRLDPVLNGRISQQSTWQSFVRGVSSEVDYLNGEVALLGRLHGVKTPFNTAVQQVLGEAELLRAAPGQRTVGEVLDRVTAR